MAVTPNFSWPTPDDSDQASQGAAAIRALGNAVDAGLSSGFVSKSAVSGNVFVMAGERNALPSIGNKLAFGNGASDKEVALPFACKLIALAAVGGATHTGTTTFEVVKNGSLQGAAYEISYTGATSSSSVLGTPLSFAAGDSFNAQATAVGAVTGGIVTFVFRID